MRLFFSIPLSKDVSQRIQHQVPVLKKHLYEGSWVKPVNQHITLHFLGEIPQESIPRLCNEMMELSSQYKKHPLRVSHLNAFPHRLSVRTLFYQVEGTPEFHQLGNSIRNITKAYGVQVREKFYPHITLARFRIPNLPGSDFSWDEFSIDQYLMFHQFELVSSLLTPTGPIYSSVATFCFPKEDHHG